MFDELFAQAEVIIATVAGGAFALVLIVSSAMG
jgi:hypothetical protein